jgi:Flp pilus assembly protein TadB
VDKLRRTRRGTVLSLGAGLLAGVVLMYVLRWPVLLVVVPAAAWGLPRLLSDPPADGVRLLEALDRWVRSMLALLSTGKSIMDAVRLSARQAPEPLAEPLSVLVKRLDDRWTAPQALQAMADELKSPDSDAVLAALILSTQRGGTGASVTLHALADSIQDRLRALREIEAERAKPRVVVRQVTIITLVALVGFMVMTPAFFAPYGSPVGQLILLALLACYALAVWAMRRMTLARPRERILRPLP